MSVQAAIYDAAHSDVILDVGETAEQCVISTNLRGFAEAQIAICEPSLDEQLRLAARAAMPHFAANDGAAVAYEGRVEDPPIGGDALGLRAFGYARAFDDLPYTAVWSTTNTSQWRPIRSNERGDTVPDRWRFDTNNRLYMAAEKNSSQSTTTTAFLLFQSPDDGSKDIIGIDFSFDMTLPSATWRLQLIPLTTGFSAGAALFTLNGTGANQLGARHLTFAATPWIAFQVQYNAAAAVFAGETGTAYAAITYVRLVTATTNRVNTTLTANRAAGVGVTATVGSTTGMYVGQKLVVRDVGSAAGEIVVVDSITSSTQFVATFQNAYLATATVQAQQIYADEIVKNMVSVVAAANPTQLSAATGLISSPGLDLTDEIYEDARMSDVLDRLAAYGDLIFRLWNWSVAKERTLVFESRAARAYTWYVNVSAETIRIERSADDAANSVYAVYQEANGRTLRSAIASSAASIARYGVTRRIAVPAQTTLAVQANTIRDVTLNEQKAPQPRISITVDRLYDASGNEVPIWCADAGRGDTIVIRNLSPILPGDTDQIRRFRLGRTSVDLLAGTVTLESEEPVSTLDAVLAGERRQAARLVAGSLKTVKVRRALHAGDF